MIEVLFRLAMVLVGFLLAFLSLITMIHSSHYVLAVILLFGGVLIMFEGLPKYE